MYKVWCANVMMERLKDQDKPIPHTVMCWAATFEEATTIIKNGNWSNFLWVKGKSKCLIRMLFELLDEEYVYSAEDTAEVMNGNLGIFSKNTLRLFPDEQLLGYVEVGGRPVERRKRAAKKEEPVPETGRRRRRKG